MTNWRVLSKVSLALGLWSFCWASNSLAQDVTFSDGTTGTVDTSIIYGLPQDPTNLEEEITYFNPLLNNSAGSWSATSGCLIQSQDNGGDGSWGGLSGGNCANIGINGDGAIRFGYGAATISQTQDVIAQALREVGIDVVGYLYQWKVKNYNANDTSGNQVNNQDPLTVTITFKDTAGNQLYSKTYDYSYSISSWMQQNGQQLFPQSLATDATGVDTITISVYGQDAGYWAGYWGPEFREGQVYGLYVYRPPEEDNSCDIDPLSSPTCPGYADALAAEQDALLEMIASSNTADPAGTTDDQAFLQSVQETSTASLDDGSRALEEVINEPVAETQTQIAETVQTQESTQVAAASDPAPSETVAEETTAAVEEVSGGSETSTTSRTSNVNALSVAQSAVAAADAVASSTSADAVATSQASLTEATNTFTENSANIQEQNAASQEAGGSNDSNNMAGSSNNGQDDGQQDGQVTGAEVGSGTSIAAMTGDPNSSDPASQLQEGELIMVISSAQGDANSTDDGTGAAIELVVDSNFDVAAVDSAINLALNKLTKLNIVEETKEEEKQESVAEQNEKEDALVEEAKNGSDNEDAKAALLGYNPNIRAYQQPGLPDGQFYAPKEIYGGQKNYDNPNSRLFNGASDQLHREMVRSQYER